MRESTDAVREHLERILDWEDAHVSFDKAVEGIPPDTRGARAPGFARSPWELIEHIRIAQEDIVDFCTNEKYEHGLEWPEDYWPPDANPPTADAWSDSIAAYRRSREALKRIVRDVDDLTAAVPTGKGNQTYLRAVLLAADHTAYHVGQLVAVRRALGIWT